MTLRHPVSHRAQQSKLETSVGVLQQYSATHCSKIRPMRYLFEYCNRSWRLPRTATRCNTLQHAATHCSTLQQKLETATHCDTLQHAATHCSTLQQKLETATHCNTLQHAATRCNTLQRSTCDIPRDETQSCVWSIILEYDVTQHHARQLDNAALRNANLFESCHTYVWAVSHAE